MDYLEMGAKISVYDDFLIEYECSDEGNDDE
jgi:hypothetical protein